MKRQLFVIATWCSCVLGIFVLLSEALFDFAARDALETPTYGLPENSRTLKLATNGSLFVSSQMAALSKRISKIPDEVVRHLIILGVSMMFLNKAIKKMTQKMIIKVSRVIPKIGSELRINEGIFISTITTLIVAAVFGGSGFLKGIVVPGSVLMPILLYFVLGIFIMPTIYFVINKLLKIYSARLILACYIAYFVKAFSEFATLDDVNLENMKKVNISIFSEPVREYLKERGLENRVYTERKKSETLNAALSGWGSFERIEIYGDHKNLSEREFEAILMHEIGHSQDYSLFKKIVVLFSLKLVEACVVLYIYMSLANKFSDDIVTKNGSFFILFVIYFLFLNRWLLVFHKLVSQTAEFSADTIAKNHGYGNELSKVLYDITVKGESNLRATWFFNSLKSYHPTVYDRIEYLSS